MKRIFLLITATVALSACNGDVSEDYAASETNETETEASQVAEKTETRVMDEEVMETKNVSYEGVVRPSGISIYMQGTHRLEMDSNTVLLLESEMVDLEKYVGKQVRVSGSVRPTVEEGGMIMRVERAETLGADPTESETEDEEDDSSSVASASSSSEEVEPLEEESSSDQSNTQKPKEPVVPSAPPDSEKVALMMNETFGDEEWTQRYCSLHIGFCVPIHRNWWYKSFGATTSSLWHVEVGPEAVEVLGDGPLLINLFSDTVDEVGAEDGKIVTHGNFVVGYRAWSGDRHIEISAPIELRAAVEYITAHVEEG